MGVSRVEEPVWEVIDTDATGLFQKLSYCYSDVDALNDRGSSSVVSLSVVGAEVRIFFQNESSWAMVMQQVYSLDSGVVPIEDCDH